MARHQEISEGSTSFVIRESGSDVPVKVLKKVKDGRGYKFQVQRIDGSGKPFGRTMSRGAGALRAPGTPVRAFGGGVAKNKPASRSKASPRPPKAVRAAPRPSAPRPPAPRPAPVPRAAVPSPATPSLPSLRGRRPAVVRPRAVVGEVHRGTLREAEQAIKALAIGQLRKDVLADLLRCGESDHAIRQQVVETCARHRTQPFLMRH